MTRSATISIWQDVSSVTDNATGRTMWHRMLHRCGDGLFLYARQLCRNDADAADVVQEAFLRVWRKHANNGVTEPDLPALCYAAVRYTVLDRQRQAARRHRREVTAGESLYDQPPLFESLSGAGRGTRQAGGGHPPSARRAAGGSHVEDLG